MKQNASIYGQSLFEVVFTLAIIALITSAMVLLATFSIKNASYSRDKTLATRYTQETVEWLRGQRDENWTAFYSKIPLSPVQKYCLTSPEWSSLKMTSCGDSDFITGTQFKRELEFPVRTLTSVSVKITIYWMDNQTFHESSIYTDFTDWKGK